MPLTKCSLISQFITLWININILRKNIRCNWTSVICKLTIMFMYQMVPVYLYTIWCRLFIHAPDWSCDDGLEDSKLLHPMCAKAENVSLNSLPDGFPDTSLKHTASLSRIITLLGLNRQLEALTYMSTVTHIEPSDKGHASWARQLKWVGLLHFSASMVT